MGVCACWVALPPTGGPRLRMVQRRSSGEGPFGQPRGGHGTRQEREWSGERGRGEPQIITLGKSVIYITKVIEI